MLSQIFEQDECAHDDYEVIKNRLYILRRVVS
ncbi:hypothetical protein NBRC3222_0197 [Acetobacter pasteurianus NBRC 3222]|nr:hypothetical protein NBRC3222_0197 [Acetobacter pasteurianus NBRC 3222]